MDRKTADDPLLAKELNDKSNLLRVGLCGAAVRARVEINKTCVNSVRDQVLGLLQSDLSWKNDKFTKFLISAFRGFSMRLKLSENESYNMAKDMFEGKTLPDAADLVDEFGTILSETRLIEYYDNVPYIREFIDALHDYCKCNMELGLATQHITFSLSFATEGCKELFDLIMQGMTDAK